ncbi:MAG: M20/M25/M40 family metallo-hydrolase, partial [Flammeovirgaceae bacterium]
GAKAEATITRGYPVTYNDPALTQQMAATLQRVAGKENIILTQAVTMAEDFSFFQQKAPGVFIFLGAYPADLKLEKQPVHHTADFMIDEKSFVTGVKALVGLTVDYMYGKK